MTIIDELKRLIILIEDSNKKGEDKKKWVMETAKQLLEVYSEELVSVLIEEILSDIKKNAKKGFLLCCK